MLRYVNIYHKNFFCGGLLKVKLYCIYARVGVGGREDRHGVVVRNEVDDNRRRHGLPPAVCRRHEQLKLRVDLVAERHGRVDDHLRTERSSGATSSTDRGTMVLSCTQAIDGDLTRVRMPARIHAHSQACTYCTCPHPPTYIRTHMHVHTNTHTHTHTRAHARTHARKCLPVRSMIY